MPAIKSDLILTYITSTIYCYLRLSNLQSLSHLQNYGRGKYKETKLLTPINSQKS